MPAAPVEVDVRAIPLDQVEIVRIACGNIRGKGQDAYVAYAIPAPAPVQEQTGRAKAFRVILLASLHPGDGTLTNLAVAEYWPADPISLNLYPLDGNGGDAIIWTIHYGQYGRGVRIWIWQQGAYREVFNQDLYGSGPIFQNMGGRSIMVFYAPQYPGAALWPGWPYAFRWDGQSFRPTIVPQLYDDFIAGTQKRLQAREPAWSPDDEMRMRLLLGRALQLQGRMAEARSEYEQVWTLYEANAQKSDCSDAARAVGDYYRALGSIEKMPQAYSMLGAAMRRAQPFHTFVAGFARTQSVTLLEPPRVVSQEGDISSVAVRVKAVDIAAGGEEVEQRFAGTWRVRLAGGVCVLESADIRPE